MTGENTGAFSAAGVDYTYTVYGKNFIKIVSNADEYYGIVTPSWLEGQNRGGLSITAIGQRTGMALYLNADYTAA